MTHTLKPSNDLTSSDAELDGKRLTEQMDSTISPTASPAAQLSYPFSRVISLVDNAIESKKSHQMGYLGTLKLGSIEKILLYPVI